MTSAILVIALALVAGADIIYIKVLRGVKDGIQYKERRRDKRVDKVCNFKG